ncbi:MAG: ASCH domain-containing protein [Candidatus Bathyarchaeia archaeon]
MLIGFTLFREKILSGEKRQTIRLKRKRVPKAGEPLYLYWKLRTKECILLKKVVCKEVIPITWATMRDNLQLAKEDGFETLEEFRKWFSRYNPKDDTEFVVIRW